MSPLHEVPIATEPLPAVDVRPVPRDADGVRASCKVVSVRGEIDIHTAGPLQEALAVEPAPDTSALVVDLSGVSFCGAVGLRALVDLSARADRAGAPVEFVVATPAVHRLLRVLGHDEMFATHPDLASACRALDLDVASAPVSRPPERAQLPA